MQLGRLVLPGNELSLALLELGLFGPLRCVLVSQFMFIGAQLGFQDVEVLATFLEVCLLGLDLVLELLYYLPYRY